MSISAIIQRLRQNPTDAEALAELLNWAEKVDQHYYQRGETYEVSTPDGPFVKTLIGFAGPCSVQCHSRGDVCPGVLRFQDGSEYCPFYPLSLNRRVRRATPNEYSMALQLLEKMFLKGRKQGSIDMGTFRVDFKIKPLATAAPPSPDNQAAGGTGRPS